MDITAYETDRIKLVPNKELHITPVDGAIEHYGKVLTIEVLYTNQIEESLIRDIVNNYDGAISNEWVRFCYVESPTIPKKEVREFKSLYVPKNIYLRHTTLLR